MLRNYITIVMFLFLLAGCKKEAVKLVAFDGKSVQKKISSEVRNQQNNKTEKKPELVVKGKKDTVEYIKDSSKYYIYFTLDDGPQLPGTRICRNILKDNNVKATFFMIGTHNYGKERINLVDSIKTDSLFLVSNHSNTHGFHNKFTKFYQCPDSSITDFLLAERKLGLNNRIARLPGRNTWFVNGKLKGEKSASKVVEKLDSVGFTIYGWDLEWKFRNGNIPVQGAEEMVRKVDEIFKDKKTSKDRSLVILVHDRMFEKPQYADSLQKFILTLKKDNRYIFETLVKYSQIL